MLAQGYGLPPLHNADDAMILSKCTIVANVGRRSVIGANSVVPATSGLHPVAAGTCASARLLRAGALGEQRGPRRADRRRSSPTTQEVRRDLLGQ
jgi:hypothetical protein